MISVHADRRAALQIGQFECRDAVAAIGYSNCVVELLIVGDVERLAMGKKISVRLEAAGKFDEAADDLPAAVTMRGRVLGVFRLKLLGRYADEVVYGQRWLVVAGSAT